MGTWMVHHSRWNRFVHFMLDKLSLPSRRQVWPLQELILSSTRLSMAQLAHCVHLKLVKMLISSCIWRCICEIWYHHYQEEIILDIVLITLLASRLSMENFVKFILNFLMRSKWRLANIWKELHNKLRKNFNKWEIEFSDLLYQLTCYPALHKFISTYICDSVSIVLLVKSIFNF